MQMGSSFKSAVFSDDVADNLREWADEARRRTGRAAAGVGCLGAAAGSSRREGIHIQNMWEGPTKGSRSADVTAHARAVKSLICVDSTLLWPTYQWLNYRRPSSQQSCSCLIRHVSFDGLKLRYWETKICTLTRTHGPKLEAHIGLSVRITGNKFTWGPSICTEFKIDPLSPQLTKPCKRGPSTV